MNISRRGFFGTLLAPIVARYLPTPEFTWREYPSPAVGAINRASYSFWRNSSLSATASDAFTSEAFLQQMRDVYNKCTAGE